MNDKTLLLYLVIGTLFVAGESRAELIQFDVPTNDRWLYPFNGAPGSRPTGSTFGAGGISGFNDRDGYNIYGWDTGDVIDPSIDWEQKRVSRVTLRLRSQGGAAWPVDLTLDEFWTNDLNGDGTINADGIPRGGVGDTDGESDDLDPGRPLELLGAGFGPFESRASWDEFGFYNGSFGEDDLPRDPYPLAFRDGVEVHAEDNIKGLHNGALGAFTVEPWAIGVPEGYVPGSTPDAFDVVFDVDLTVGDGEVEEYFQEAFDGGRLFLTVSSLASATFPPVPGGFASFYMKEGDLFPGFAPPRLEVEIVDRVVGELVPGDADGDGDVDGDDLGIWRLNLGTLTGASLGMGDFDSDGDVDGFDFGIWQVNYGRLGDLGVGAFVSVVPEPGSVMMLGLGLAGVGLRRGRRRRFEVRDEKAGEGVDGGAGIGFGGAYRRVKGGFTIVELLVTIGIIAVLLALILPTTLGASEKARQVVCRSNLRQIWAGVVQFSVENRKRVPYFEDINLKDKNADPFDPKYPTTVGVVMKPYLGEDVWTCPSAVAGYPANAGRGNWEITYRFSSAGPVGSGRKFGSNGQAFSNSPLDPAMSNYVHFDGRPLSLIDGRRYTGTSGLNENDKGFWTVRRPIIADALGGQAVLGRPVYPHRGRPEARVDLERGRQNFERMTRTEQPDDDMGTYMELHADGDQSQTYLTRKAVQHREGY